MDLDSTLQSGVCLQLPIIHTRRLRWINTSIARPLLSPKRSESKSIYKVQENRSALGGGYGMAIFISLTSPPAQRRSIHESEARRMHVHARMTSVWHTSSRFLLALVPSTSLLKPCTAIDCSVRALRTAPIHALHLQNTPNSSSHPYFVSLAWPHNLSASLQIDTTYSICWNFWHASVPLSEHRQCKGAEDHGEDAASQNAEISVVSCREDHQDQLRL
ncbi:hypothetical protein HBI73_020560 [Parastagonospora nodorum]|nr:hypothetical protein HBI76_177540 [Parastagonospora nodorum]KAH5166386.1 hypothetical protein HBI73_020560 [Parastagonospora nodorum]